MSSYDLAYTKTLDLDIFKEAGKVSEYLCPLCTGVYHNPVVDHCGHVFCRECIKYWLGSIGKTKICPISKTQYDSNIEDQIIHPLTVIQIIIEKLEVRCKNDCGWEGKLSEMFIHIKEKCPNSIIDCRNRIDGCLVHFIRTDRINHEDVCDYRPSQCENCEKSVPIISMSKHLEACPKVRVECPQKCTVVVERVDLENHVKNKCENTRVNCAFALMGCEESFLRSSLKAHNIDNMDKHNQIVANSLLENKEKLEKVTKTMDEFNQNLFVLTNNMNSNSITESMYEQLIDSYNKKRPDEFIPSANMQANTSNSRGVGSGKIYFGEKKTTSNVNNIHSTGNIKDSNSSSGEKKNRFITESLTQKKRERNISATTNYDKNTSANIPLLTSNLKQSSKDRSSYMDENKFLQSGLYQQDDQAATDDIEEFMNFNSNGLISKSKTHEKDKFTKTNPKAEIPNQPSQISLDHVNISKGVVVTNNKAFNSSMAKNEHKFIFANLFLNKADAEWKVVITKKSSWIGVGCCIKETVISNNYKFASHLKSHGCFMISSNGYLWNTNNPNENNCVVSPQSTAKFDIETGDVIKFSYKWGKNELTAHLREYKICLTSVFASRDTHLVPCVVLLNYGDEVTFTN